MGGTYWLSADRATLKRINRLTGDALRDPAAGIGKPEPLRHMLATVPGRTACHERATPRLTVDSRNESVPAGTSLEPDSPRAVLEGISSRIQRASGQAGSGISGRPGRSLASSTRTGARRRPTVPHPAPNRWRTSATSIEGITLSDGECPGRRRAVPPFWR